MRIVGVKIGDLNLSAETNSLNGNVEDRSGLEALIFETEYRKLKAGEVQLIDIRARISKRSAVSK